MNKQLYNDRSARLMKFIELDAGEHITAIAAMLLVDTITGGKWKTAWWSFIRCFDDIRGSILFRFYELRYRLTGADPQGFYGEEEEFPEDFFDDDTSGRVQ